MNSTRFPKRLWALTVILASVWSFVLHAETSLSISGTKLTIITDGEARQAPDVAHLTASVVTEAEDAQTALQDNAARMNKVLMAAKASAISDQDIQTQQVHLNPQYRRASPVSERNPLTITGYRASNTVRLRVREVSRLGRVLDALVAGGANQVYGPDFSVEMPEPALNQARVLALEKARRGANVYAESLGMMVARVVSIEDSGQAGNGGVRPMTAQVMTASAQAPMSSVEIGEQAFRVRLTVVFELSESLSSKERQ